MPPRDARRLRSGLLLAAAFGAALALRFLPYAAATDGGLRLLSPDCYGHLRRSVSIARHFPRVPVVDPYLNHPDGGVWIWPPAFDLAIGGAARLLFGKGATPEEVEVVAATLPPLLGALHVFPLFAFARRALGRRRALLAVAVYAVLPAAILWSSFGHADHHVAEVLVLLLFLAAAAAAAQPGLPPGVKLRRSLLAGTALAGTLFVWQGAVFAAGLAFPWALVALGPASALLGAAATLLTAAGAALYVPATTIPFSFVSFGWFQPLLLAAGTIPLALFAVLKAREKGRRLAYLLVAALLLTAVVPNFPRLFGAVFRGGGYVLMRAQTVGHDDFADGGYLSYPPELMKLIAEAQPLLPPPRLASILAECRELSIGLVLLPIALLLWIRPAWRLRRRPGRRDARLLLVLFAGALLLMTLFQRRNVYYLGVFTSLALAELVARVPRRLARSPLLLPASLAAALVVLPGLPDLKRIATYAEAPGRDFLSLMERLGTLDPPRVDPATVPPPAPGAVAGVMAPWSAGHFVTALSRRPAAADPFQYGWRRQARLFTTPDDTEALAILSAARCKYLVTAELGPFLPAYAAAAGHAGVPPEAMFLPRVHRSRLERPLPFLRRVLDSRTGRRLPDGRVLPNFRVFRVEGVEDLPTR